MNARQVLVVCVAAAAVGFASGAAGVGVPAASDQTGQVRCFEDGSCTDGYCEPLALCDESSAR